MINCSSNSPIIIIGTQRSGTTLLRLILNAHSEIAIPEEGTFWMPLLRRCKRKYHTQVIGAEEVSQYYNYILKNSQFRLWGLNSKELAGNQEQIDKVQSVKELMTYFYKLYARKHKKSIWGDKTPSFFRMIPILVRLFPNAKFIHVVRDGRDVYLSWKKLNPTRENTSVAALEWVYKIRKIRHGLKSVQADKWIEVRYEDVVAKPKNNLRRICEFLGIKYEDRMRNFWKTSEQFIGLHHSDMIFNPISTKSAYKWRKELTPREIEKYECIGSTTLQKFGYGIQPTGNIKYKTRFAIVFELTYGLPLRMIRVIYTIVTLSLCAKLGLPTRASGSGIPASVRSTKK